MVPTHKRPNRIEQLLDVPLRWHAMGFAFIACVFIVSVLQHGGVDAGSLVMGGMAIGFGIFLILGNLRRRIKGKNARLDDE